MKRPQFTIWLLLLALLGSPQVADATQYYASKSAVNGAYVVGSDSNNGLTPATAVSTVTHAVSLCASSGDTINLNPGSGSDVFREDDGANNGLNLNALSSVTIQTDPAYTGVGRAIIKGNGSTSTKVVNIPSSSNATGFVFTSLVFDGENLGINIIAPHNQTVGGLNFNSCQFKNITSGSQSAIGAFSSTGNVCVLSKCTIDSTVNRAIAASDFGGSGGLQILGGTYSPVNGLLASTFPNTNACNLTVTKTSDGQRPAISGCASGAFFLKGTGATSVTISFTDFSGNWSDLAISAAIPMTSLTFVHFSNNTSTGTSVEPSVFIQNCTSNDIQVTNNTCNNSVGFCSITAENANNVICTGNQVTLSGTATVGVQAGPVGTGAKLTGNFVNVSATASAVSIMLGMNGYATDSSNVTSTGNQNFNDVSGNTFLDQAFTTSALTTAARCSYVAGASLNILKSGSPSGNITCALYADSSGTVTGSALETATITVAGSSLTTSAQSFFFQFSSHTKLTAATKYHLVFSWSGSVSGSNFIEFQNNSTTANGVCQTSTTGPGGSWSTTSKALLYTIWTGSFGSTDGVVSGNKVVSTSAGNQAVHGCLIGCVTGATLSGNQCYGPSICLIAKSCFNSKIINNVGYTALSQQATGYDKGSQSTNWYDNSLVCAAGSPAVAFLVGPDPTLGVNAPLDAGASKNNVLMASFASGSNFVISLVANTLGAFSAATFNNDLVWNGANTGIETNHTTWSAFQGAGYEAAGKNADPLLINESTPAQASDFTPQLASPAIMMGANLLTTVPSDYNGSLRNANDTVGAVVYSPATNDFICRSTNATPYVILRQVAGGAPQNLSTRAFDTAYSTGNYANYVITLGQQGTASGIWVGSVPPWVPSGWYLVDYRYSATTPAETDAFVVDTFHNARTYWSGTSQYLPAVTDASGRATLTPAEHTLISGTDTPAALTAQGLTMVRAGKIDNLDAAVSTRSTFAGGPVSSVTNPVTVGTNNDKSGYALSVAPPTTSQIAAALLVNPAQLIKTDSNGGVTLSPLGLPQIAGSVASSPAVTSFVANAGLSPVDGFYSGSYVAFTSGVDQGLYRQVSNYIGASRTFVFVNALPAAPAISDTFNVLGGTR